MTKPKLLLTGAAGRIGRAITPALEQHWDVAATDLPGTGLAGLDVTDLAACRQACVGADAVVHMAGVPDPNADWDALVAGQRRRHPSHRSGGHGRRRAPLGAGQ